MRTRVKALVRVSKPLLHILSMLRFLCAAAVLSATSSSSAANKPRLFVHPPGIDGAEAAQARRFEVDFAQALADSGKYEVKTSADLEASLQAERTKDLLGCNDTSCLS